MTIVRHIIDPATGQAFFVTPDNPSTIGLDGPIGSLANMAGGGRLFSKFGAAVTDWQEFAPVTTGGVVNSVFGRTGNVIAQSGDYDWSQIAGKPSTFPPSAHTHAWATDITGKPTTIGGYGITDFNSLGDARWSLLGHTHTFASLTSKPTTIGGYGITDFNSLGDARWVGRGSSGQSVVNLALAGNVNPYVQFSDGTYTAYWQMASGAMSLYHNGASRIDVTAAGGITLNPFAEVSFAGTRPITVSPGSGFVRIKGNASGWAQFFGFMGSSGTDRGGFGAYGTADALTYYYIGTYGAEQVRIWPDDAFQVKSRIINMSAGGGPTWFQLGSSTSPASCQLQFGTDNSGYAFEIAKNVGGTVSAIARFYDGGSGTNALSVYGSMEGFGNITIQNGASFYGRRATGNAQVAMLRYDSGTDDISTVLGGSIMRWRDTGSGVYMTLDGGAGGVLDVLGGYNIGGVTLLRRAGSYHTLTRQDGGNGISLGGTADPASYYDNTIHYFRSKTGTVYGYVNGSGVTAINFILSSDARLKHDLVPLYGALDRVSALSGYTFTYERHPERRQAGILAQEVQAVLPEAVHLDADGYLSVSYDSLIPLLIEAVKELRAEVRRGHA